jgi:hypothetical protein
LRLKAPLAIPARLLKKLFASSALSRRNSKIVLRNWLVPLLVTRLMTPPPRRPNSALTALVCTLNSCTASTDGV